MPFVTQSRINCDGSDCDSFLRVLQAIARRFSGMGDYGLIPDSGGYRGSLLPSVTLRLLEMPNNAHRVVGKRDRRKNWTKRCECEIRTTHFSRK